MVTLSVHGAAAAAASAPAAASAAGVAPGTLVADHLPNDNSDHRRQQGGHQQGAPIGTEPQQHGQHFLSDYGVT